MNPLLSPSASLAPHAHPSDASPLYQVFYQSQATGALPALEQLHAILACSRTYNAAHGITGVLLSSEGYFVQLLEGPEAEVRTLYTLIQRDARHQHVQLVREQAIAQRGFPHWSMGFGQVAAAEILELVQAVQMPPTGAAPRCTDLIVCALWQALRQQGVSPP